ncbi:hypothetical protein [Haloactinomyces albus]|uniref:Membrane protein implicated in regulation of membrane protease activity n=1 Tax=Haloactinomyces albus TaxID=1352928 RepID=A0AAE3ZCY1_9ACTN|nr:hypothetical protein [Haloactinomyces albus]MDR7301426.1 membrane protein implicated in regulation of membrane protease activity [Haloactinomyces albus]
MRNAQPRWRRYLWLLVSVIFALNGLRYAFFGTSLGPWPLQVVFAVGFFVLAALWFRNFLTTVNRRNEAGRQA